MNDSQKFLDSLHNIPWKEGLSDDILKGVQSFLAASNGGDVVDGDPGTPGLGASASMYQSSSSGGRSSTVPGIVFCASLLGMHRTNKLWNVMLLHD